MVRGTCGAAWGGGKGRTLVHRRHDVGREVSSRTHFAVAAGRERRRACRGRVAIAREGVLVLESLRVKRKHGEKNAPRDATRYMYERLVTCTHWFAVMGAPRK